MTSRRRTKAIVDDINAHGGIHGRKLDATIVKLNPTSPTQATSACTKLTQDDKVFVAVGFFLADSVLCYVGDEPDGHHRRRYDAGRGWPRRRRPGSAPMPARTSRSTW